MPRPILFFLSLCLFASFILLLLVSLSLPIIKALYLVEVNAVPATSQPATSIATTLRFGIWGFCATGVLDQPTFFTNNGECTPAHLGYDIDPAILALTGHAEIAQDIEKALTVVFVLHPIAAGLALLAVLCALPSSRSHCCGIFSLLFGVITAFLTTAVLAIDFTLIGQLMSRIGPLTGGDFNVRFGNCPWMVLAATVLIWISVGLSSVIVCNCCGCGRRRDWDW
ncbi:hypothetical protein K439DRAFT_1641561 [Ramaria rubella]|nr:hypothetical protein K439DRAFT_1641561 [Ramaria rubella]